MEETAAPLCDDTALASCGNVARPDGIGRGWSGMVGPSGSRTGLLLLRRLLQPLSPAAAFQVKGRLGDEALGEELLDGVILRQSSHLDRVLCVAGGTS